MRLFIGIIQRGREDGVLGTSSWLPSGWAIQYSVHMRPTKMVSGAGSPDADADEDDLDGSRRRISTEYVLTRYSGMQKMSAHDGRWVRLSTTCFIGVAGIFLP